ncbi:hypothetical protein DINM_001009 [Dirofilaria immitis]|nr:hypothetical protein [Dirofilaria immitis]
MVEYYWLNSQLNRHNHCLHLYNHVIRDDDDDDDNDNDDDDIGKEGHMMLMLNEDELNITRMKIVHNYRHYDESFKACKLHLMYVRKRLEMFCGKRCVGGWKREGMKLAMSNGVYLRCNASSSNRRPI